MTLSVEPENGEGVLLGKKVSDMQSDIVISDTAISGTLHYISDYTGFSSNVSQQSGNYLALKVNAPAGATTTVEVLGGSSGPVTLDSDMNIVLRIANANSQKVKVTTTVSGETTSKTYRLTGLTLEAAP